MLISISFILVSISIVHIFTVQLQSHFTLFGIFCSQNPIISIETHANGKNRAKYFPTQILQYFCFQNLAVWIKMHKNWKESSRELECCHSDSCTHLLPLAFVNYFG